MRLGSRSRAHDDDDGAHPLGQLHLTVWRADSPSLLRARLHYTDPWDDREHHVTSEDLSGMLARIAAWLLALPLNASPQLETPPGGPEA